MRVGCDTARDAAELVRAVRSWLNDAGVVVQDGAALDAHQALDDADTALELVREVRRHGG